MVNVVLIENRKISNGNKREIEIAKLSIKRPTSLLKFKEFVLSKFGKQNIEFIKIYSVENDGDLNELREDSDLEDPDNNAFRAVYDEDIQKEEEIKEEVKNDEIKNEEENNNNKSMDEDELLSILNEELKKEEEKNINNFNFNIKSFNQQLLNKFINKQEEIVNQTKLKIDNSIKSSMIEQSEIFTDLQNIPQIQQSILSASKSIIYNSKINLENNNKSQIIKKKEEIKKSIIIDNEEKEEEKEEYDFQFIKDTINLTKTTKEAKWIEIKDIDFQNIGKDTFTGGDLYFFKEESSSEDYYFVGIQKDKKQGICLSEDLMPNNILKENQITIRNEEPLIGNTYSFNISIKSDKKEIKMKNILKIKINVIEDNLEKEQKEKEEKKRKEKEQREKEEKEKIKRQKEEEEKKKKEELEKLKKEEEEKKKKEEEEKKKKEEEEKKKKEEEEKKKKEEEEKKKKEEEIKKKEEEEEKFEEAFNDQTEHEENSNNGGNDINNGEHNNNNNGGGDDDDEERCQKMFDKLEESYYISSFKPAEEIKRKIRELNFNEDEITAWVESVM